MLIHSVTPPEMLIEAMELPRPETKMVKGGILEGVRTEQGFQATRLLSTDPSLYLKKEYSPGSLFSGF